MTQSGLQAAANRIRVESHGSGAAIVMTHGFGDSAATWDALRPILSPHYQLWSWDLLGHGRSAKPESESDYSLEIAVADLEAVIAAAAGDVVLIGHSLGGYLSQYRCVQSLDRVRALVLIATGPGFRSRANRERWNAYVQRGSQRFDAPNAALKMAEMHDDRVMANLEKLTIPVLQICGERDVQYHAALDVMRERVAGVESMRVAGAGHHVHRSHAQLVGERILAFLQRLEPRPSAGAGRPIQ